MEGGSAISLALNALLAITAFLLKTQIDDMKTDIKNNKKEMDKIKENYLDRFEKLNNNINESKVEIVKELSRIYLKISESNNHNNQ